MYRLIAMFRILAATLGLVGTLAAGSAPATTIYSDFGPGNAHSAGVSYPVPLDASAGEIAAAMQFTSNGNYKITQIDVAIEFLTNGDGGFVTLNADNGGSPGALLGVLGFPGTLAAPTSIVEDIQTTFQTGWPVDIGLGLIGSKSGQAAAHQPK
jgi:hypothetical protein